MNEKVFRPHYYIHLGLGQSWRSIFRDFYTARHLGAMLFLRDFQIRYRQSFLGLAWALLLPVFTAGLFFMLFRSGIMRVDGTRVPYPVFVFLGITAWQLFSAPILTTIHLIKSGKTMNLTHRLYKFAQLYSPLGMVLTDFMIRILFLFVIMALTKTPIHPAGVLAGLLAFLPLLVLGMGCGLITSLASGITRDIGNSLNLLIQFLMFVSPVLYPVRHQHGFLGTFTKFNPLTYLLDIPKDLFFFGQAGDWGWYGASCLLALFVLLIGLRWFFLAFSRILQVV